MKMTKQRFKKLGKKAAATAAGLFAAAAIALSAVVDSPDELFTGTPQAAQVVIAAAENDERTVAKSTAAEPAQKTRLRDQLRRLFFAQPSVVRGVVLLPFWAVGKALIGLVSLLFTALNPFFQIILGVLLNAILLFGLFALVFKLLFPHLSLRKFLTKRNILLLAAGALVLSAADVILRAFWEDYRPISIAIKLVVGLVVLSLLAWRIFGKRVPKQTAQTAQPA